MGQRILVFESDPEFAREVEQGFSRLGASVEVVADGNVGLDRAAAERPDLILLSIELPSMNGFLVCKKIKKTAELKDVPLVILSSDPGADDIFEQHKKLKTRAEEYVRKPVPFATLLATVRELVPINGAAAEEAAPEESTEILTRTDVDAEIEAFADNAFDTLFVEEDADGVAAAAPMEAAVEAPEPPARESVEELVIEDMALEEDPVVETGAPAYVSSPPARMPSAPPPPPPGPPAASYAAATSAVDAAHIADLEARLSAAESKASEAARLQREVDDLKARAAKSGGVSSREFLDLREQLNSKDKQILALKDQVSSRDKEILEVRDASLVQERAKADFDERTSALESDLGAAKHAVEALRADKDAAAKRAEDYRARLERTEEKGKRSEAELEQAKRDHQAILDARDAEHQSNIARLEESHAETVARMRAEHAAYREQAKMEHQAAVDAERQNAATSIAQLEARSASAMEALRDEHGQEVRARSAAYEAARDEALAELRAQLETTAQAQMDAASSAHRQALAAREEELQMQNAAALAEAEDEHGRELALLGRKLADTESKLTASEEGRKAALGKVTAVETERAGVRAELEIRTEERDALQIQLAESTDRIAELTSEVASKDGRISTLEAEKRALEKFAAAARTKIATDDELLERTRKALAIGLGLLEDQGKNRLP